MDADTVRVHLRHTVAGEEQSREHFWVDNTHTTVEGSLVGTVTNVLWSSILGYGDTVEINPDTLHVTCILTRSGTSTYVINPTKTPSGPVQEAAWAQLVDLITTTAGPDVPSEAGFGPLLIHCDDPTLDRVLTIALDSPEAQPFLSALTPGEDAIIEVALWCAPNTSVGTDGPELDGWALIAEPDNQLLEPPADPNFTWDPAADPICARYVADHPIAGVTAEAWFKGAINATIDSSTHQQWVREGDAVRVLFAVANLYLIQHGLPRLPNDLDDYR